MQQVLIIEDNYRVNRLFCDHLAASGFATHGVVTIYEAIQYLSNNQPDILFLDLDICNQNTVHTLLSWVHSETCIIVLAERDDYRVHTLQPDYVLTKPINPRLLSKTVATISQALQQVQV